MRLAVWLGVVVLCASSAMAEVRLLVRPDGRKLIYNTIPSKQGRPDFEWLARQRTRVSPYDAVLQRYCDQFAVDPILAKAVIVVESNFEPECLSTKGAQGLMQLMPATARRFRVNEPFNPEENIRGGVAYLSYLLRMFPGDLRKVLAAYNAGENAVIRYGGIPPYQETQLYVQKALTVYFGRPYGGGTGTFLTGSFGNRKQLSGGFRSRERTPALETLLSGNQTLAGAASPTYRER